MEAMTAAQAREDQKPPGDLTGTYLAALLGEARSEMVQPHRVSGRAGDDQVSPLT